MSLHLCPNSPVSATGNCLCQVLCPPCVSGFHVLHQPSPITCVCLLTCSWQIVTFIQFQTLNRVFCPGVLGSPFGMAGHEPECIKKVEAQIPKRIVSARLPICELRTKAWLFSWVNLSERKWVTSRERRGAWETQGEIAVEWLRERNRLQEWTENLGPDSSSTLCGAK